MSVQRLKRMVECGTVAAENHTVLMGSTGTFYEKLKIYVKTLII